MGFTIRMGIPEMLALWAELQTRHRDGTIKKKDEELYKKWGKSLAILSGEQDQRSQTNVLGVWSRPTGNHNYWFGAASRGCKEWRIRQNSIIRFTGKLNT